MYAVISGPARDFVNWSSKVDPSFPEASHKIYPSTHVSWNSSRKLGHSIARNHAIGSKDRFTTLKCKSCLRVGAPFILGPKRKLLKLSAFKSNSHNDESRGRPTGSKSLKNSVGLPYAPQESEGTFLESQKPQSVPSSYSSGAESTTASPVIQNLFKSWLMLLQMPSPNHAVEETLKVPSSTETSETQNSMQKKERADILKTVWCYFWSLDATIKIPLLMFIPMYLAVNILYGAEVCRELTPLWVLGPLIAALYVKLLRGIFALYVFSFKQTVKVITNLPAYYLVTYDYIAHGKLNEVVRQHLFQPLVDIKNLDYNEAFKRKLKDFEVFLVEKYLDTVESIWPFWCRMIRFLKRAHLL